MLGYNNRFKLLYPILKGPWKKIIQNAAIITTPSNYLTNKIKEIIPIDNSKTIPNGLDFSLFKPVKKQNRIIIVARLFINKGIQDILDAIKDIQLKGWKIDIIGDGPYKEFLYKKTVENNLSKIVTFHGWIDHKDKRMKELYGRAKIFISASYFESFGQTVLEAISSGCYPLISDIESHKFIVKKNRYLFRCGDVDHLQKKIHSLLQKDIATPQIKVSQFSWDTIIDNYIQTLKKALKKK